jgi:hypothetical protein
LSDVVEKKSSLELVDWIAIVGLVCLVAGIAWIYKPAALIVLGLLLLFYAFVVSMAKPKAPDKPREES